MTESSDLVLSTPQQRFLPTEHEAGRIGRLAQAVATTEFVPRDLRGKPEAIMAAMLTGREIGIGPMHALRGIDVIDGRPSLSAELMASLVFRAGHTLWVIESTAELCTMGGRRADWPDRVPDMDLTWSVDDAVMAGMVGDDCDLAAGRHAEREVTRTGRNGTYTKVECGCKDNWRRYPRAMLRARATSELCRAIFPDVVERVGYVAEELGSDEPVDHREQVEVVRQVAPEHADVVDATYADDDDAEISSTAGDGEASAVEGPSSGGTALPPDGADVPAPSDDTDSYDWRAAARGVGVTPSRVLAAVVRGWPANDQSARPSKLGDLDALVESDPVTADTVRALIDGLAAEGGAA